MNRRPILGLTVTILLAQTLAAARVLARFSPGPIFKMLEPILFSELLRAF
jgi:hypothetical protein